MTHLATCTSCEGFLPPTRAACPHCDAPVHPHRSRPLARRLLAAAGAGAMSITLMACYGMAPVAHHERPIPAPACAPDQDRDRDGACAPADCNDDDPAIKPGAADTQGDDVDQNCDGVDGIAPETSVRAAPGDGTSAP